MDKIDFPEKATAENIPTLIEMGHRIENLKPWWAKRHLTLKTKITVGFTQTGILILAVVGTIFLWVGWVFVLAYLGWLPIIGIYWIMVFSMALALLVFLILLILWRNKILPKFYPPPNQIVFCELVEIAECILNKKRRDAVNTLYHLGSTLRKYFKKNNELEIALKNEMQPFYTIAIDRLILFSRDKKFPNLFLNLGLAFAKEDEPMIYSTAVDICKKIKKFNGDVGKSRGFWFSFEEHAKSIGVLVSVALVLLNVVLIILYVLHVIPIPPVPTLP